MEDRVERLWAAARKEEAFCKLENSYSGLEKKFEETLSQMPRRQQDLLWGFVLKSEELNQYLLNLALDDTKVL